MRKLLSFALSAMFYLGSAAQDNVTELTDTISQEVTNDVQIEQNSMLNMVQGFTSISNNVVPPTKQIYPLGKGLFKKQHVVQALELYPSISKSRVSQSDLLSGEVLDDINDTGYGLDCGYTVIIIPGYEKNGQLHINKAGLAYHVGFIASFKQSDRYGTLCDFIAKLGLEACYDRRMGISFDFLAGYGRSCGDVFFYKNITEDTEPSSTIPYNAWGPKFGGQLSIKTGLLGNTLTNIDVLLFARLLKAKDPGIMSEFSSMHHNFWRSENWSFGVILCYRL